MRGFGNAVGLIGALALLLVVFAAPSLAGSVSVQDVPLNQEIEVVLPSTPVYKKNAPELMKWIMWHDKEYVRVYRVSGRPGAEYTLWVHWPPGRSTGGLDLFFYNPLAECDKPRKNEFISVDLTSMPHIDWSESDCKYFSRRRNFRISPDSEHGSFWLIFMAEKPGLSFRFKVKHPAEPDSEVDGADYWPYCPERDGSYTNGKVVKEPKVATYPCGEPGTAAARPPVARPEPHPPAQRPARRTEVNLNGVWQLKDSRGKSGCKLLISRSGDEITGVAQYDTGNVPITGQVAGGKLKLTFIYDSPEVLKKWVDPRVASQIVGVKSYAEFTLGEDLKELKGTKYGWRVNWDANKRVKQIYNGGTPEAARKNPPRPATLARMGPAEKARQVEGACNWVEHIKSGRPFKVVFDAVEGKFNDEGFTGDHRTDPMGTLKAGETYRVVFKNGKFECTGFNESTGASGTWAYGNANPEDGLISLWGRVYAIDGQGRVWDPRYGIVGSMVP